VVINTIASHAEVVGVETVKGIAVLFKLIRRDNSVMTTRQVQSGLFVVSDQTGIDPGVFVTSVELDSIATVIADRNALKENLIDQHGLDAVSAFLLPGPPLLNKLK